MGGGRGGSLVGPVPASGGGISASARGGCSGRVTSMVTSTGDGVGGSLGGHGPASGGDITASSRGGRSDRATSMVTSTGGRQGRRSIQGRGGTSRGSRVIGAA